MPVKIVWSKTFALLKLISYAFNYFNQYLKFKKILMLEEKNFEFPFVQNYFFLTYRASTNA